MENQCGSRDITQSNAANAEEAASSAQELNAQSEQLRALVLKLNRLVDGKSDSKDDDPGSTLPSDIHSGKSAPAISFEKEKQKRITSKNKTPSKKVTLKKAAGAEDFSSNESENNWEKL